MKISLQTKLLAIIYLIQKRGFKAYLVGGAVRDIFLHELTDNNLDKKEINIYDYDLTTNATPDQIQEILIGSFYENKFGTVSISPENFDELLAEENISIIEEEINNLLGDKKDSGRIIDYLEATKIHESLQISEKKNSGHQASVFLNNYEITTFRSEELYESDNRQPTSLIWGESIEEDLLRRDFTINALAIEINDDFLINIFENKSVFLPAKTEIELTEIADLENKDIANANLIDLFDGWTDLKTGVLRAVGEPKTRFEEDPLRMLRGIRFSVQLDLEIEEQTWVSMGECSHLLKNISGERIRDEFLKMLASPDPAHAINLLDRSNLLLHILPELIDCDGCQQNGHHTTDVWTHALDALHYCPSPDPIVRLAALIHDIGKPPTQLWQNGQYTFYNHHLVGAKMAGRIAQRLKFSRSENERLYTLVRFHMFHYQEQDTDASVRRLMREVGLENLDDLLAVREADRLGSGSRKTSWRLEELKERMIEQLNQPFDVRDLAIDGHDLMEKFDLKPGPVLGKILNELLERVLDDAELNDKEKLFTLSDSLLHHTT